MRSASYQKQETDLAIIITPHLVRPARPGDAIRTPLDSTVSGNDADLFLIMRVFSPYMKEIVFQGALDPKTPIAQGWLRVSHMKLDKKLSQPYRPYHTHDEEQKL